MDDTSSTNPFDDAVASVLHQDTSSTAAQIRNNLQFSTSANPDTEAGYKKIAATINVPVEAVRAQPEVTQAQATLQDFDADKLAAQFPHTAKFLTNMDNTRMVHDDIPATAAVEQTVKAIAPTIQPPPQAEISTWTPSMGERIRSTLNDWFGLTARANARAMNDYALKQSGISDEQARQAVGGMSGVPDQAASKFLNVGSFGLVPDVAGDPKGGSSEVSAGLGELGGFVLGGPIKATEWAAGKLGIDALEHAEGQSFAKGLAKDVTAQSLKLGTASALAATGDALDSPDLATAGSKVLHAAEGGAEMGAIFGAASRVLPENTIPQTVARIFGVNAALDLANGTRPDDNRSTEKKVFDYGINSLFAAHGAGGSDGGWFHDAAKADLATQDYDNLKNISAAATASKLRPRDSQAFKQFVSDVSDDDHTPDLYIDANTLAEAFNQSGISIDEVKEKMPDVAAQIPEALGSNGMVKIPMADYATHIAGSQVDESILPHVRTDPDGSTYAEAQEFYQNQKQDLTARAEKIIAAQAEDATAKQDHQIVYDKVLDQLNEANRFKPDVNKTYATLARDFYVSTADKLGITPSELMDRYPLKVAVERMLDDSKQLNQVLPEYMPKGMEKGDGEKLASMFRQEDKTKAVLLDQVDSRLAADGLKKEAYLGSYSHSADQSALKHITKAHTNEATEAARGQLPITDKDIAKIPDIVKNYDGVRFDLESAGGRPAIAYVKKTDDGVLLYTEEVHNGRRDLAALSMRKYPATRDANEILESVRPNVRNDSGHKLSIGVKPDEYNQSAQDFTPDKALIDEAVKHFGTTRDLNETGYILPDGRMLDMTGRHQTSQDNWPYMKGERAVDHRDLAGENLAGHSMGEMFNAKDPSDLMYEFMARTGAMRVDFQSGVASASREPTPEQLRLLEKGSKETGYLATDFIRPDGHIVHDAEFDSPKLKDIKNFYDEAISKVGDTGVLAQGEGNRGAYNPDSGTIALLKDADLSTFIHELGHHFLELTADIASQKDAPPEVAADFDKLLNWFGVDSANTWHNLSFEEKRSYHEQFARGFEAYLLEGKAPSVELQGIFARMRTWLLNVYKSISALNVELTPEVRNVMGRMLASEDAIKSAEQVRGYAPLFKTATDAGMTPEQYADYQKLGAEATENAVNDMERRSMRDMRWLSNAKSKALRDLQREADSKRREVRIEASKEIWSQPVYQAWQFLTAREYPIDPKPKAEKDLNPARDSLLTAIAKLGGLNRESARTDLGVHEDYHKQSSGVFGKPLFRKEGGLTADGMAEALSEHGYLSLDHNGKHDLHELEDKISNELAGTPEYSYTYDYNAAKAEADGPAVEELKDRQGGRLDTDKVRAIAPQDAANVEALRMTRHDALDPDLAAEMFGFTSGKDLIEAISKAEHPRDAIEGLTDQRMLEKHGELSDPQQVERAAEAAIHNEARARFVATELKALTKAQGPARRIAEAAKEAAEAAIAAKRVKDLNPNQYTAAEAKAGRNADKALLAKDIVAAANEKRAQLLNNRLARAASDAVEEVRKGVDYLKKFDKPTVRENIELEYREQIDALLDQYDLRKGTSKADLSRRQSLRDWYADKVEQGYNPALPDYLMDDMTKQHYKDLPMEQFRGLVDGVKSIEHLGRLKQRLLDLQDMRDFNEVVGEAITQTDELPKRTPESNRGLSKVQEKWLNAKSTVRSLDASLLKMEQVFDWLDKHNPNGIFNRIVFRRIADAGVKDNDLRTDITAKLKALGEAMPKDMQRDLNKIVTAPELIDSRTGEESKFTKSQILAMALNTGNESNMSKMAAGEKWQERAIWQVLDRNMTKDDWQFVQGVWDAIESLWPEIQAMERRLGNSAPDKIVPRSIATPHGEFKGGYYPAVYDPLRSFDVEQNRQRSGDKMFENNYTRATTPKGHTIARTESYARPFLLSLDVLPRHLSQVIHDIAYREAIIDADRFLGDKRIREAIETTLGREYYAQLRPWLQAIANDKTYDSKGLAFWDKAAHWARTSGTIVGLGFRLSTMMIHGATAASNSVGEIGPRWMASGVAAFAGSPEKMTAARDFIYERSGEMRNRMNETDRDVRDALREMELHAAQGPLGAAERLAEPVRRTAYYGIAMLDMASAMPTWMGAYNKALHENFNEQDAIYAADKAVRNAHGGGGAKDSAAIQRGAEFQKLFTMFYSFWNHFYNRQRDIGRTAASIPGQIRDGNYQGARRDFGMVLARSWFYFIIPQLLHAALKPPPPGQQDDHQNLAVWMAEEIALGLFSGIPVVRDIAGSAATGRDYVATPAASIVTNFGKTGVDIRNLLEGEDVSNKWLKHSLTTAGYVFGLPTGQVGATAQFLWDLGDGTQDPQDLADWWAGIVHGDISKH